MHYPQSRQELENALVRLKRDVMIFSIKKHTLSKNSVHVIQVFDHYLPEMVARVKEIFTGDENNFDDEVEDFRKFLHKILYEALHTVNLDEVIINEETDMIAHVKNEFVEIMRSIEKLRI